MRTLELQAAPPPTRRIGIGRRIRPGLLAAILVTLVIHSLINQLLCGQSLVVAAAASESESFAHSSVKIPKGSEWNFDNQALQTLSSQLLCRSQNASREQQVNVVTFTGNQIDSIEPNAFRCVASELRILILTSNEITHIPLAAFEGLHWVQVLLLDNNQLTSIPSEDSLSSLKSLRHLNLADNRIEQLQRSSFGPHLSGLISLNLAGNPLLQVHPHSLIHLIKLKTLTLSRCSNDSFSEWPLEGLSELQFLHLDRSSPRGRLRLGVTPNLCQDSPKMSSLILKSNAIERVPQFAHCQNLLLLDLSYNNIRGSLSENFTQQPNLIDLYLGNNQLESIADSALIGLHKLQVLELQNNRLMQIEPRAFTPVQLTLEELNLSHNPELIHLTASGLDQLKSLNCYGNHQLRQLPHFKSATRLALTYAYHCCDYPSAGVAWPEVEQKSLIVRLLSDERPSSRQLFESDNSTSELILWPPNHHHHHQQQQHQATRQRRHMMMDRDDELLVLSEVKRIRRQHSIFVEFWNKTQKPKWRSARHLQRQNQSQSSGRQDEGVRCLPSPGPFLPCKDLFDSWWLRVGIWSVFLLAFLGNTIVIIVLSSVRQTSSSSALTSIMWLAHSKRHIDVPRFLVINLAIADLLMALYLGLLAFVDLSTLGEFKLHAIKWQYSNGCKLAGFLAVLSSELSVFILAIITLERNYAITNAVHLNRRLSLQKAMFIMFLGYAFALGMAIMPLYGISDYRRFSVCLPLDVDSSLSSQIYVITLISINTFSFVLLLGCYLRMYFAIRGSQAWNANDLRIAKRMSILVLTDFLCWMPIIASGLASLFGYHLIGTEGMKTLTIFILPLNSVANPFLYAITTKKFKRDLSTLHRRTRALVRLECIKASNHDKVIHHHAYLAAHQKHHYHYQQQQQQLHSKLQCHTAHNSNSNRYRHDLLLTGHQHKGGAKARMRLVSGGGLQTGSAQRSPPKLLANRNAPNNQSCVTCSCQQQRRQDLDQQQQQVHMRPRIVLETATQTITQQVQRAPPPTLMRKSRSTNSGLTMLALRRNQQDTSPIRWRQKHYQEHEIGLEDVPAGCVQLTKVEESMMIAGEEPSLYWRQQQQSRANYEGENRNPSPLSRSAANSLLVQQEAAAGGQQRYRAAASRSNLSVDPFPSASAAVAASAGGADIRSASACGQLASCRSVEAGDNETTTPLTTYKVQLGLGSNNERPHGVGGSCDTVRVTSGGGGGGNAIKISRSIQRLLFGPLAKAWSSIQISLNSSVTTHVGHQQQQSPHLMHESRHSSGNVIDDDDDDDNQFGIGHDSPVALPNGDYLDDILMMSSPLKSAMRMGERRMSRSCDAIQPKFHNNNHDLLEQLNSPSQSSGQEQSSSHCEYDDDQRVLLATINRLAAGDHRNRLAGSGHTAAAMSSSHLIGGGNTRPISNQLRARCTRCRSWSPALLTKLENCIFQMKSKISSGFVASQNAGAIRLDDDQSDHQQLIISNGAAGYRSPMGASRLELIGDEQEKEASCESEIDLEGVEDEDDLHMGEQGDGVSLDDQFGDSPHGWTSRRHMIGRMRQRKGPGRLRQQSSINSDTLSTRTAGTLMTNMSLSSDSNASIHLALAGGVANHQPTHLDIITDADTTQDDDDICQ